MAEFQYLTVLDTALPAAVIAVAAYYVNRTNVRNARIEKKINKIQKQARRNGLLSAKLATGNKDTAAAVRRVVDEVEEIQDAMHELDKSTSLLKQRMDAHSDYRESMRRNNE